ncbi:DUF262 domain-containing protein [Paenibacillus sp. MBLB4367]|uniref:DUF262 domain-containing protein n=1 Tax=Paenibacillus sp. MBLB4367 TaxID=3384767 RepID=UPI0039083BCD
MADYFIDKYRDSNDHFSDEPFDIDQIRVNLRMVSVMQIINMIKESSINLYPDFQRHYVWKEPERKSLLIESLMLLYPLPIFYAAENQSAEWEIVDGLQRLSTIYEFINDGFTLKGLQYLWKCEGYRFNELPLKYKQRIYNANLTFNVIDSRTPVQAKFDLFRRLNTGGIPLNSQEIRNSIANNNVRRFLVNLVNDPNFQYITNYREDPRMLLQELVLRFCAFYDAYDRNDGTISSYRRLEEFLDQFFEKLLNMQENGLHIYETAFKKSMQNSRILFENLAFRRIHPNELDTTRARNKPLNKTLFTSLSVELAYYDIESVRNVGNTVLRKLADTCYQNIEFAQTLNRSTASVSSINIQFKTIRSMLKEVL